MKTLDQLILQALFPDSTLVAMTEDSPTQAALYVNVFLQGHNPTTGSKDRLKPASYVLERHLEEALLHENSCVRHLAEEILSRESTKEEIPSTQQHKN